MANGDRERQLEAAFAAEAMRAAFEGVDGFERWGSDGLAVEAVVVDYSGGRIFVCANVGDDGGWMRVSFLPGMSAASVTSGLQKAAVMPVHDDGESSIATSFGMIVARGSCRPKSHNINA